MATTGDLYKIAGTALTTAGNWSLTEAGGSSGTVPGSTTRAIWGSAATSATGLTFGASVTWGALKVLSTANQASYATSASSTIRLTLGDVDANGRSVDIAANKSFATDYLTTFSSNGASIFVDTGGVLSLAPSASGGGTTDWVIIPSSVTITKDGAGKLVSGGSGNTNNPNWLGTLEIRDGAFSVFSGKSSCGNGTFSVNASSGKTVYLTTEGSVTYTFASPTTLFKTGFTVAGAGGVGGTAISFPSTSGSGASATIKLFGAGTKTITTTQDCTIDALVVDNAAGAGGLGKAGAGVLTLTNANTYTGGTTLSAGKTQVGVSTVGSVTSGPFGTGTVTMTGGTISSNNTTARTLANALSLNGTMTLGDTGAYGGLTFTGTTTISAPTTLSVASQVNIAGTLGTTANAWTRAGSGVMFLTGPSNSYTGAYTNNAGDTYLASGVSGTPNQLNAAASLTLNGGSLNFLGGTALSQLATQPISGSGTLRVYDQGGVTINGNMNTPGFSGIIETFSDDPTGNTTPSITFASSSAFPLSASQITAKSNNSSGTVTHTTTYSGAADITTTTQYWGNFAYQTAFTRVINHSATGNRTWTIGGSTWISNDNAKDVALQFNVASGNTLNITIPFKQFSTGLFSLEKLGTGTMTLSGDNQISKTITVTAGTLNANSTTALGPSNSTAGISVTSGATLSLGAALSYPAGRSTSIIGTGSVASPANGALIHAYAGTANVGTINLGNAAYIRGTASGTSTLSSSIANGGFALTAGAASGNTLTLTGGISGLGGLVVGNSSADTGTVALTTANTYQGNTTLSYGTLSLGNATALGSVGTLVFNGGTIDASTTLTVANALTVSSSITFAGSAALTLSSAMALGASRTITTNGSGGALTLSGVISGATFKLTKAGTNTLTLTNANTYSGGTDIGAGTLKAGNTQALGTSGTVTLTASGATLQTLTTGGQNGKLTVAALTNSAGGTIKIGG